MKNNIKKTSVKFREDLLYFQHFMLILSLPQISDYHYLKIFYSLVAVAVVHSNLGIIYKRLSPSIYFCCGIHPWFKKKIPVYFLTVRVQSAMACWSNPDSCL